MRIVVSAGGSTLAINERREVRRLMEAFMLLKQGPAAEGLWLGLHEAMDDPDARVSILELGECAPADGYQRVMQMYDPSRGEQYLLPLAWTTPVVR